MAGKGSGQVEETPAQRAMAEHATNLMRDYEQRWLPVQKRLIQTVQAQGAEGSPMRAEAMGKSNADTEAAFGKAQGALESRLSNTGALPGSSKANLAVAELGNDKAASKGLGKTVTDQRVTDAYLGGLSQIMALGRGEKAQATAGMGQIADMSGAQARQDAGLALQDKMGYAQLGAQAVGMGIQQGLGKTANPGFSGTQAAAPVVDLYPRGGMPSLTP